MLDLPSRAAIWHTLISQAEKRRIGMLIVSHDEKLLHQLTQRIVEI
ncbi:hypothetical protein RQN30_06540 [Arcanobacterium hippocoleae]